MNYLSISGVRFLFLSIFVVTSLFLILPSSVSAAGKVWEASWGLVPNNEEVDFIAPDITSSSRVYAVTNGSWGLYNKNGTRVATTSVVASPREVEIVGNNYYVAYSTGGQMTARKLDSSLNTLQTYSYSSSTWPTLSTSDVTVDSSNNVYIVGQALSLTFGYKWVVVKFNNAGVMQWVHITDFGGSHDAENAQNAQAIGNYVYVTGTYSVNGTTPRDWVAKYSATSTAPVTSYINGNAGGNGSCETTVYNNLPYSICNVGYVYSIDSSTGFMNLIMSATPSSGCSTALGAPKPVYVSSTTGIVYTAGGCNSTQGFDTVARTYISRFNLATNIASGPFFLQPFIRTDSNVTYLGTAVYAEDGNYAFVGGATGPTSGAPQQDYALWRVSMLTCTGPISFGSWTDNPTVSAGTPMKAAHITELRTRVNTLRTDAGLATTTWTDPTLSAGTGIKAQHINELRTAIDQVYSQCVQATSTAWTDTIQSGATALKAQHVNELRTAVSNAL